MIIAIWEFEKDSNNNAVPQWIRCLHSGMVPRSWINAIQASDISNFARGTRVGVVVHSQLCRWVGLVPVMVAKKIPVFFLWSNAQHCHESFMNLPILRSYLPSIGYVPLAKSNPPSGTDPIIYHLYRDKSHCEHPDLSVEDITPPHGPYQLPGETHLAFISRRKNMETRILAHDSNERRAARERREIYARRNMHPHPNSSVYLWTIVDRAFPDKFPTWGQKPYRLPVCMTSAHELWISLPVDMRTYNATFNEWDIWMPENPDDEQSQSLEVALQSQQSDTVALNVDEVLPMQLEEISTTFKTGAYNIDVEANYIKCWFGVTPSVQQLPNINYKKLRAQVGPALGYAPAMVPDDTVICHSLSGWAWAMSERQWDSPALQETWDLDDHNPQRISLPLRHLTRVLERVGTDRHTPVLFKLSFCDHTEDQPWKLLPCT
ncbi:hypothetical protein C8Q80DRAFT_1273926 [Daedaleopsis nitida]|nr:hypothetical protein C8Q80DRAFT_1273926 [Daedaleopsis nitida]